MYDLFFFLNFLIFKVFRLFGPGNRAPVKKRKYLIKWSISTIRKPLHLAEFWLRYVTDSSVYLVHVYYDRILEWNCYYFNTGMNSFFLNWHSDAQICIKTLNNFNIPWWMNVEYHCEYQNTSTCCTWKCVWKTNKTFLEAELGVTSGHIPTSHSLRTTRTFL